jgi:uncharacterized repeat protein (TIGR01451 family)
MNMKWMVRSGFVWKLIALIALTILFCAAFTASVVSAEELRADFEFTTVCNCMGTQFTDNTTGGVKPYTKYCWDFSDGTYSNGTVQNPTHHYDAADTYIVTLTVTDSIPISRSQSYDVTVYPNPTADAGDDKSISGGGSVAIGGSPTASGGTPPYTYSWSPLTGLSSGLTSNPIASPSSSTTYTVTVTDDNGCTDNDSMTVFISQCVMTKTPSVSTANYGEIITYSFTVTNTGNTTLSNLTLTDSKLGAITLNKTTLPPKETAFGSATHTVVVADFPGPLTNTATASSTDSQSNPVTCSDDASVDLTPYTPEITINKTASLTGTCPGSDPLTVQVGDTVTYCFNVTNTGDVMLYGITVIDNIYGPVTLGTTTLAPGASIEGTLTHVVEESDAPSVTDTATAMGTDPLDGTVTDTDNCTIKVLRVALEKSSSPTAVAPGGTVPYTIKYTNTGGVPITDVVITESYPQGVTFVSASPAPDSGTNNRWIIGTLPAGASGTITLKIKVPEPRNFSFSESGGVSGEGLVVVSKELSTEQALYSLRNVVTLACAELPPVTASAVTQVSGVQGTRTSLTEHGSGMYSSEQNINVQTENRSIYFGKSTEAEYKPTSFDFGNFEVNFSTKWNQNLCSKNKLIHAAIWKRIDEATYLEDETISEVDKTNSAMRFDSSFNGSLYIGARTDDSAISETYIGEFNVSERIAIGKPPEPTPTPTPTWLPCPFPTNESECECEP